jgi:hypothetical protein
MVALAIMPGAASAAGDANVSITGVQNQGGLYTDSHPSAAFFDVTATNLGISHLTHEDVRVYIPASFTPLAAFTVSGAVQTAYPGCSTQDRGGDASLPAFVCSWDDNWYVGDGRGPITFAIGGSTAGTFSYGGTPGTGIYASLSPAAQPPIGEGHATVSVSTSNLATLYTGPKSTSTTIQTDVKAGGQGTKLVLPPTSTGYVVDVSEATGTFTCGSTTPSDQIGQLLTAHINQGATVSPYIQWTMTIVVPGKYDTSHLAIYHCTDSGLDTILQSETCGAPTATAGCMVKVSSKYSKKVTTVTVVFETLTNGVIKGGFS